MFDVAGVNTRDRVGPVSHRDKDLKAHNDGLRFVSHKSVHQFNAVLVLPGSPLTISPSYFSMTCGPFWQIGSAVCQLLFLL